MSSSLLRWVGRRWWRSRFLARWVPLSALPLLLLLFVLAQCRVLRFALFVVGHGREKWVLVLAPVLLLLLVVDGEGRQGWVLLLVLAFLLLLVPVLVVLLLVVVSSVSSEMSHSRVAL